MGGYEVEHAFETIGRRVMLLNARRLDDHQLILLVIEDVTGQRKHVENLREGEQRQAFLLVLSDRLRSLSDPVAVMAAAAELFGQHLGAAGAGYNLVDVDEDTAEVAVAWGDGRLPNVAVGYRFRLSDDGPGWRPALRTGEGIYFEDHRADAREVPGGSDEPKYPGVPYPGVRAGSAVPLRRDGRLVAWLWAVHPEPHVWTEEERRLHRDVAERSWAAVERARAEEPLRGSTSAGWGTPARGSKKRSAVAGRPHPPR